MSTPPGEVNAFHDFDDLDNGPNSHHHTIGDGPFQAAPGDHTHKTLPPTPPASGTFVLQVVDGVMSWVGA